MPKKRKSHDFGIVVDSREPPETAWSFGDNVAVTRACLPSGDYAPLGFELEAVVERKTLPDFIACCTFERRRFWAELERLRSYQFAAVIIEASAEDIMMGRYISRTAPLAVLTSALAIQVDYRIGVLFAGDRETAARCCEWMLRRWVAARTEQQAITEERTSAQ